MKIFYSDFHIQHDPPYEGFEYEGFEGANLKPALETAARAEVIATALRARQWAEFLPPDDFGLEPVLAVHNPAYLEYLRGAYQAWQPHSPVAAMAFIPGIPGLDPHTVQSGRVEERYGFFLLDTSVAINAFTYAAALTAANCALSGAQALREGQQAAFALCRPPGHHAGRAICGGYCFLNNAAIAAQWLSQWGKVALLDVDYHAGNGTQEIFYERPDVFTVSLHADPAREYPNYAGYAHETGAGAGRGFHRNFPLPAAVTEADYLHKLGEALALIADFAPRHLVVSLGMDIYREDLLGDFEISRSGIAEIGRQIARAGLPSLVVMEGGYYLPDLGENVAAFLEPFST
jgi:acetoin utilization deacetylase AcuC-like enzyme